MKKYLPILLALTTCLTGCNSLQNQLSFVYFDKRNEFDTSLFYGNVQTMKGADPSLIWVDRNQDPVEGGYYYAYITANSTINAWRTKDMTNWQNLGAVFRPDLDDFWGDNNFWAPAVIYDQEEKLYYMYYSGQWKKYDSQFKSHYISVAKSSSPVGPFTEVVSNNEPCINFNKMPKDHPLYEFHSGDQFENGYFASIDAEPFIDPVDNQLYLLLTHDIGAGYTSSQTYIMKMNSYVDPDYSSIKWISQTGVTSIGGSETIDEGKVNEGPYMFYHNGYYYLTYSVNTYNEPSYQVRQAISTSPTGPFRKIPVDKGGVIITTDGLGTYTNSSGHHSFIKVGDELFISYHTFLNDSDISEARKIRFDRVSFVVNEDGLPLIYANGPTVTLQPLPSAVSGYKNIAPSAHIEASNVHENSDIYWLNDGTLKIHDNSIVDECEFNNGKSVISLTFDDYQTIKAIMVYNSNDFYKTFKEIDNIRLYLKKDGIETVSDTGVIPFNYHEYSLIDQDYKTVFAGASSTIEFNDLEVNKIEITVSKSYGESILGISEIQVLGKENA